MSTDTRTMKKIAGYVYCVRHEEIHEDCLDPYGYGAPEDEDDDEDFRCEPYNHMDVYARPRKLWSPR